MQWQRVFMKCERVLTYKEKKAKYKIYNKNVYFNCNSSQNTHIGPTFYCDDMNSLQVNIHLTMSEKIF